MAATPVLRMLATCAAVCRRRGRGRVAVVREAAAARAALIGNVRGTASTPTQRAALPSPSPSPSPSPPSSSLPRRRVRTPRASMDTNAEAAEPSAPADPVATPEQRAARRAEVAANLDDVRTAVRAATVRAGRRDEVRTPCPCAYAMAVTSLRDDLPLRMTAPLIGRAAQAWCGPRRRRLAATLGRGQQDQASERRHRGVRRRPAALWRKLRPRACRQGGPGPDRANECRKGEAAGIAEPPA